jgi:hypothetical protein
MGCSFLAPVQNIVGKVADVVVPIAAVIPGPWQVPAQIAQVVMAVDKGGIKAAIPAVLSIAVGQVLPPGSITGSLAADASIKAAGVAAATGGDPVKAALTAAVASGLSSGSDTYSPPQPAAVDNIFSDSTSGDFSAVPTDSIDPYAFSPSYSLADGASTGASGFVAPPLDTAVWDGSSPVDYSLPTAFSQGLQILPSPSLPSMGGGQGLTVPVEGGTVGSLGFTPTGASPVLGDPASFINNPAVTGQPIMATEPPPGMSGEQQANLLKSLINAFGAAGTAGLMGSAMSSPQQGQQPAYQPASTMPNYSPEYFQQVQQKYNQFVPSMPANVAAPLSQWYNQPSTGNGMMSSQPSIVQQGMFNRPAPPVPMGGSSLANLGTSLAGAAQPAYNPNMNTNYVPRTNQPDYPAAIGGYGPMAQPTMSEDQYNQSMPDVLGYTQQSYADYVKSPGEIGYNKEITNGTISQIGGTPGQIGGGLSGLIGGAPPQIGGGLMGMPQQDGQQQVMSEEQYNNQPMPAVLGYKRAPYADYLKDPTGEIGYRNNAANRIQPSPGQIGGGLSGLIGGAPPQVGGGLGGIQQQPLSEAEWNTVPHQMTGQLGAQAPTYSNYLNSFNQPAFQGTPYTPGLGGGLMGMLNRS